MVDIIGEIIDETRRLADPDVSLGYERYVELVNKRQQLVELISTGMLSEADKLRIQQLKDWEEAIVLKMQFFKDEANEALTRIQNSKKHQTIYNQQASHEGFMFDKKN